MKTTIEASLTLPEVAEYFQQWRNLKQPGERIPDHPLREAISLVPSPPSSLILSQHFILCYVTMASQAPGFTITTASSAGPRPITHHVSESLRA